MLETTAECREADLSGPYALINAALHIFSVVAFQDEIADRCRRAPVCALRPALLSAGWLRGYRGAFDSIEGMIGGWYFDMPCLCLGNRIFVGTINSRGVVSSILHFP